MSDKFHSERRKHPRIYKPFILAYFDLSTPLDRHDASQLKNISIGGMCLVTSRPFAKGTSLGIELKTPFLTEFLYLEGTVLESKEKIKDMIYETRLAFSVMSPHAESVLNKIIEHFKHEEEKKRHE